MNGTPERSDMDYIREPAGVEHDRTYRFLYSRLAEIGYSPQTRDLAPLCSGDAGGGWAGAGAAFSKMRSWVRLASRCVSWRREAGGSEVPAIRFHQVAVSRGATGQCGSCRRESGNWTDAPAD
jgi:hypothetical protein